MDAKDRFGTKEKPTWCPGCGDFAIWNGVKNALTNLNIPRHRVMVVYGIGCAGNMNNFIKTYSIHAIHGRTLPVATGVRLANHGLKVITVGGDGDAYGIGMSHFIHACRRNLDITSIVSDNQIYGLTTGQYSPTSEKGFVSKTSPEGSIDSPVNPMTIALSAGATFIARGFSGYHEHLEELIKQGLEHKGFSFIDVFQPCVTFNKINTYDFFRARVYDLKEENHNTESLEQAFNKALEWGDRIPIGVFYKKAKPTYEDEVSTLKDSPLVKKQPHKGYVDVTESLKEYM